MQPAKRNILLILITICMIPACLDTLTMIESEVMNDLLALRKNAAIEETPDKEMFIDFFKDEMIAQFKFYGYDHRIQEIVPRWSVFEDGDYVIFIGSVAKSDDDIYFFTLVYHHQGDGVYRSVFQQIGKDTKGEYPDGIIPYRDLTVTGNRGAANTADGNNSQKENSRILGLTGNSLDQIIQEIRNELQDFQDYEGSIGKFHQKQVESIDINYWETTIESTNGYIVKAKVSFEMTDEQQEFTNDMAYHFLHLVVETASGFQVRDVISYGLQDAVYREPYIRDMTGDGTDEILLEVRFFNGRRMKPELSLYTIEGFDLIKQDSLQEYRSLHIYRSKNQVKVLTFTQFHDFKSGEGGADPHKYYVEVFRIDDHLNFLSEKRILTSKKYNGVDPKELLLDPELNGVLN